CCTLQPPTPSYTLSLHDALPILLVLNSPHNPTGGVLPAATLQALAALVQEHDLWVISDEIYAAMAYDGDSPSIATLPGMAERTRSEEHTSELQSLRHLVCRLLLE